MMFFLALPVFLVSQNLIVSNDTTICIGGTATLVATPSGGGYGTDSYTFQIISYAPETYSGGTGIIFDGNGDDRIAGPFDLGFSFCFFNQYYTQFWVGSNGWIGFTYNAAWTTFVPTPIPNTAPGVPKNCIMAPWQDWYPGNGGTFTPPYVFYKTIGSAPNRKLVVYWLNCPMYGCLSTLGTFQIVLNEQNSIVENHLTNKPYCSWQNNAATQGVHNLDGTVGFTATGRNCTSWTTSDESTRFVPSGVKWYVGGFPGGTIVGYGQTLTISPIVTTTYTAVVETCSGGNASADVEVTVIDPAFTYPANAWCQDEPDPIPALLQPGGTFTASPPGLVFISTITGQIDLDASAPGTYTVTRTITTPCVVSTSHEVTINALPSPPAPSASTFFRCGPGDITISVIPVVNESYAWYDAPAGGTQYPGTGPSLTIFITATTVFYVEAMNILTQCFSTTRTAITGEARPVPIITNNVTDSWICSGDTTSISLQSDIPGSVFTWSATGSSPQVTGFSNGSGNSITQILTNASPILQTVTYSVTATFNQCQSLPVDFIVSVYPVANLIVTPSAQTICSETWSGISLSSTTPGVTFSWTVSGTAGITGFAPGSGNLIQQKLFNMGYTSGSATYVVTPAIGGCQGVPGNVMITVEPAPQVTLPRCVDTITTTQAVPVFLKGGIPPGGQYAGPGVNSATGIFTPSVAGSGIHKIYYTYVNMLGCQKKDSMYITVQTPLPFSCDNSFTDIRDNRIYPTVQIGAQCWMAANLNYGQQIISSLSQRDNCVVEKYCYNDLPASCTLSGGRYQWDEVMTYQADEGLQGLCPPGWHLPAESEWTILFNQYINNGFAGSALKITGFSGFNALLAGFQGFNMAWRYGPSDPILRSTLYWSSTSRVPDKAWAHGMNEVVADIEYTPSVAFYPSFRNNAFAVRCLKD